MGGVVAVEAGNAGEQILVALAGHQIAIVERGAAEIGQQRIAGAVHAHLVAAFDLHGIVEQSGLSPRRAGRQADISIRHAIHPEPASVRVKRPLHIDAKLWRDNHILSFGGAAHHRCRCWKHGARGASCNQEDSKVKSLRRLGPEAPDPHTGANPTIGGLGPQAPAAGGPLRFLLT